VASRPNIWNWPHSSRDGVLKDCPRAGDAENAGVENAARSKLRGVENAGVEISGWRLFDRM